jgi:hypothetical protein
MVPTIKKHKLPVLFVSLVLKSILKLQKFLEFVLKSFMNLKPATKLAMYEK